MSDQTLSHYRIAEELGQAGMGEVYRAEDIELSWQVVVLSRSTWILVLHGKDHQS
jgi:hypothetical protein